MIINRIVSYDDIPSNDVFNAYKDMLQYIKKFDKNNFLYIKDVEDTSIFDVPNSPYFIKIYADMETDETSILYGMLLYQNSNNELEDIVSYNYNLIITEFKDLQETNLTILTIIYEDPDYKNSYNPQYIHDVYNLIDNKVVSLKRMIGYPKELYFVPHTIEGISCKSYDIINENVLITASFFLNGDNITQSLKEAHTTFDKHANIIDDHMTWFKLKYS